MDVHFTAGKPGETRLRLDGVDITDAALIEGFSITLDESGRAQLAVRLRVDRLTVDGQVVVDAAQLERADLIAVAETKTEQEAS
jgi:hypothetical protein